MGGVSMMAAVFILFTFVFAAASGTSPPFIIDCVEPTPSCPKNEEYRCRNSCPPETCMTLYAAFDCIANQTCKQGCYCKKGYLRTTTNGTCVLRDQCLPLECVNDPNAQSGCGIRCGKTCADCNDKTKVCPKGPCKLNGCDCKPGFVYDVNVSKCVKPGDCTQQCTKPHERYSDCLIGECQPKTCDDLGKPLACPAIAPPCAGGCTCEAGYVKDCDGNCIDSKTCPSCGGDVNAQSGCGNPCGKTCASINANKSDLICAQYCLVNGCDCKDKYVLNTDTKKCVLIKDCPKPPVQCGKNEEYYCGASCPEASCDVPSPPICINKKCELKCYCKKGFVRDAKKNCVPNNTCPVKCTNPNEKYIDCLAGQCNPKTCKELILPAPCPRVKPPCPGGCICVDGYVRDDTTRTCIKKEKCPNQQCTKAHERYSDCLIGECKPQTCDDLGKPLACPAIAGPCAGGCTCEAGYVKDCDGNCIDSKTCPSCGGDVNAQSGCGNPCGKTCAALLNPNNKTACPLFCNTNGCDCREGYLLNTDTKKCVPVKDCPKPKCTNPNEKYIDCLAGQCIPKTCKELQNPAPCPRVEPPCLGGCICVDGYVRDDTTRTCIKKETCPIICNGPNEQNSTCSNKQCTPTTCKEVVNMPFCPLPNPGPCTIGCVCKNGFVRSDNKTCVAIKDCPEAGTCADKNQEWVQCAVNCGPSYCPTDDTPQLNCFLPAGLCHPGCHCKPNYRVNNNKDNKCILASDCPPVTCTRANEVFSSCPTNIQTCATLGTKPTPDCGPTICNPQCVCKKDFYKNDNGTCVAKCDCPTDSTTT